MRRPSLPTRLTFLVSLLLGDVILGQAQQVFHSSLHARLGRIHTGDRESHRRDAVGKQYDGRKPDWAPRE